MLFLGIYVGGKKRSSSHLYLTYTLGRVGDRPIKYLGADKVALDDSSRHTADASGFGLYFLFIEIVQESRARITMCS